LREGEDPPPEKDPWRSATSGAQFLLRERNSLLLLIAVLLNAVAHCAHAVLWCYDPEGVRVCQVSVWCQNLSSNLSHDGIAKKGLSTVVIGMMKLFLKKKKGFDSIERSFVFQRYNNAIKKQRNS